MYQFLVWFDNAYRVVELSEETTTVVLDTGSVTTEEGWTRDVAQFTLDDRVIRQSWMTEGRDCDGYIRHSSEMVCSVDRLAAHEVRDGLVKLPDWDLKSRETYDAEAVKAGY